MWEDMGGEGKKRKEAKIGWELRTLDAQDIRCSEHWMRAEYFLFYMACALELLGSRKSRMGIPTLSWEFKCSCELPKSIRIRRTSTNPFWAAIECIDRPFLMIDWSFNRAKDEKNWEKKNRKRKAKSRRVECKRRRSACTAGTDTDTGNTGGCCYEEIQKEVAW